MEPIQDLLNRIRWDANFGAAEFSIGYYDHESDAVIVIPFATVQFTKDDHFAFDTLGADGEVHHVPLHRIRAVYRNGQLIWQRAG